ncbi:hypothetical protein FHS96_005211 [Sphingomonas zeicaulis]|uniref:hypothetical protein n=1 Tax=Sphingomonas zeicaulis TaxID=1632740 RepID=UPI003D1E493C
MDIRLNRAAALMREALTLLDDAAAWPIAAWLQLALDRLEGHGTAGQDAASMEPQAVPDHGRLPQSTRSH